MVSIREQNLVESCPVLAKGRTAGRDSVEVTAEAQRIHDAGFVWDGHNDLPGAL